MSRIFWDTKLFVYLFEGSGEVLVKPMKLGDTKFANEYRRAIPAAATLLQLDEKAASLHAKLRRDAALRAPDAIQLACAGSRGVDLFVNDARLHGKQVDGIQFITPIDRVPI